MKMRANTTVKRASTPMKMRFARWNEIWWRRVNTNREIVMIAPHQTRGLTKNFREGVNDLHNRVNVIDEFPILVSLFLEPIPVLVK